MSNEGADRVYISEPVDLSRQVYVENSDYQLLCCGHPSGGGTSGGGGSTDNWLTAAELVYDMTGNPGRVVSDIITFDYDSETRIEIKVLGGEFAIIRGDDVLHSGRKAFELLMRLQDLTFEGALEWIAEKYSVEKAEVLAHDYVARRLGTHRADEEPEHGRG
ncbi:hypothetical protein [Streptomyces fumanus]|uniref:Uncharacterized protein n=1 Tax=Streptomyces fumanus TaxID=67302 RepID=A0A919AJE3_9ACTN|nr:hypothetical protein [Streptomyces fumanus]GHF08058.1 hypothetical protein GCM10018772_36440 [Streptomyces fumanus]